MEQVIHRCDFGRKPCGARVPDDKPFEITLGGTKYAADLCQKHQDNLLSAISVYIDIARPVRNDKGRAVYKGAGGHYATKDVRAWAIAQGYEVAGSGRLPDELHEEYKQAHGLG